jgi:hypothetical protein
VSFFLYPELKYIAADLWDVCGKMFYEIGKFVPTLFKHCGNLVGSLLALIVRIRLCLWKFGALESSFA